MKKYNDLDGVPKGHFYLREIVTFGDFEVEEQTRILYTSDNEQDLIDYCKKKNYELTGAWCAYFIQKNP